MFVAVAALDIHYHEGGLHLPELGLWLDAHHPVTGSERVFVSHAHSDHTAPHREVILTHPTACLVKARLGGERVEHVLPFGEARRFEHGGSSYGMTLLPAGHVLGSAMAWIEAGGSSLLFTGDFKLRRGLSAEPCEPRRADVLVMETTYGRPQYRFPPTSAVMAGVVRFCQETIAEGQTAVLLGYSLGKSQELLSHLAEARLPVLLHREVHRLTAVYEACGLSFPPYERLEPGLVEGKVVICPPHVASPAWLRNLGNTRVAVLTGWALDAGARYRSGAHAAFPLSDHADFDDLLRFVELVAPGEVLTLHGFAADFARVLRERGYKARALSEVEQLELGLGGNLTRTGARDGGQPVPPEAGQLADAFAAGQTPPNRFEGFASACLKIASNPGKLVKIEELASYLREVPAEWLPRVVVWFGGQPFASVENRVLQVGWAALRTALCAVTGVSSDEFHQVYLRHSDLGETAADLWSRRAAATSGLSLEEVDRFFQEALNARGPIAKVPLLTAVLNQCSALEAKYLVKIITGDLRIGLKEGLVESAIAVAFHADEAAVRRASLLLSHLGETAALAREGALAQASLVPFRPVRLMLASPEPTASAAWARMQAGPETSTTVWIEDKYDGIRCQVHRVGGRVALFSRDSKDITATFPEIAEAARSLPADVILDGELLAFRGEQALPFAELQKRLGRREQDWFLGEDIPVSLVVFDLLWRDRELLLDLPLASRRDGLVKLQPLPPRFRLASVSQAGSAEAIEAAFLAARGCGNEGLMLKDPLSPYTPGRRGFAWLKLKKAFATLDCVVVAAEYGHGKRSQVLSDYTFAVRDEASGALRTIGKAYTGLTDAEIAGLTRQFLARVIRQRGRVFEVEPEVVLEVAFDRIQPSRRHNSGLALRFPRIARIRTDKTVSEIDTLATARRLAGLTG